MAGVVAAAAAPAVGGCARAAAAGTPALVGAAPGLPSTFGAIAALPTAGTATAGASASPAAVAPFGAALVVATTAELAGAASNDIATGPIPAPRSTSKPPANAYLSLPPLAGAGTDTTACWCAGFGNVAWQ